MNKRKKGTYKYTCEECKAENWLTARERTAASRPRCIECGSTWLQLSHSSKGHGKIADANAAAYEQKLKINKEMGK